jgi:biotin transport system substrate-specific component
VIAEKGDIWAVGTLTKRTVFMKNEQVLSQAVWSGNSLLRNGALVLGGSAIIAIAAQIAVPMFPVPMTLQTLAILALGLALGARLGVATMLAYLAEGAAGLPVFAKGGAGLAYMAGPTAGFLIGFVLMIWIVGAASDRGWTRSFIGAALAALVAAAVLYLPGLAWPAVVLGKSIPDLMTGWALPFLAGDFVKAVLAALIITGGWAALRRRSA